MSMQNYGEHDEDGRLIQVQEYKDGRTKQSFRDETDINKILHRAQSAGTLSHLQKHEGTYSDFSDFDFLEAQINLTKGREIFDVLPSELRNEFSQSPAAFFAYVNDPENADKLREKLPGLSQPGRQNIDVSGRTPPERPSGALEEPKAPSSTTTAPEPEADN